MQAMRSARIQSLLFLFLAFCLFQCKTGKQAQSSFFPEKKLVIDYDYQFPDQKDPGFEIYDVSIRGNALYIYVRYQGGEDPDSYELITNGLYTKTLPPMVPLYLKREPAGSAVRDRTIMQELIFDVQEARQWADDEVIFRLVGYPNVIIYRPTR